MLFLITCSFCQICMTLYTSRTHPIFLDAWCFCSAWALKYIHQVLHMQTTFHGHIGGWEKAQGTILAKMWWSVGLCVVMRSYFAFRVQCEEVQLHTAISLGTMHWITHTRPEGDRSNTTRGQVFSFLLRYSTTYIDLKKFKVILCWTSSLR